VNYLAMSETRFHTAGGPAASISLPISASLHLVSFFLLVLLSLLAITGLLLLQS
jgi:hypothetical protein